MKSKRKVWKSERKKRGERKSALKLLKFVFETIFFLFFIGVLIYLLFFASFAKIKNVRVKGGSTRIEMQTVQKAEEFLSGKFLWFFPKNGIVLFNLNKQKMVDAIRQNDIKEIFIEYKWFNSVEIEIKEREGALNWCNEDDCVILDSEGEEISKGIDGDYPIINEKCSIEGEKKKCDKVKFIFAISKFISTKTNLKIKSYFLEDCFSQKLVAKVSSGPQIYFDLARSAEDQGVILEGILAERFESLYGLEYIDLQVEGKVFYK